MRNPNVKEKNYGKLKMKSIIFWGTRDIFKFSCFQH